MEALITIVIPVYNSSQFLKECLTSVANQTFKNFEVILVDDCSIDDSYSICDDFCKLNSKFSVIKNNCNYGVSYSRNIGISNAKGKYICFIDSDDFIDKDFLQKLYDTIKNHDIVFTRFDKILPDNRQTRYFETRLTDLIYSPSLVELFFVGDKYLNNRKEIITDKVFGSCCRSLFRLSIIKEYNIEFLADVKLAEDTIFMMNYLHHCKKCGFVDEYLYHYRENSNSAVKRLASNYVNDFYNNRLPTLKAETEFLKKNNDVFYSVFLVNYIKMDFNMNFVINELKINEKKSVAELKKINEADYNKYLLFDIKKISKLSKINCKRKFFLFLVKYRLYSILTILLRRTK